MVFEHYRSLHPTSRPGDKESAKVRARIAEGYSAADLCKAIDGCHASPFHCGENANGRKYQSLELIVRDSSHVNQFMELAEGSGPAMSEKTRRTMRAADEWLAERMGEENAVQG